jgi:hypothetical protein
VSESEHERGHGHGHGHEPCGPFKAGDLVMFPGNRFTRGRPYAAHIDQATADRLNKEYLMRQQKGAEGARKRR